MQLYYLWQHLFLVKLPYVFFSLLKAYSSCILYNFFNKYLYLYFICTFCIEIFSMQLFFIFLECVILDFDNHQKFHNSRLFFFQHQILCWSHLVESLTKAFFRQFFFRFFLGFFFNNKLSGVYLVENYYPIFFVRHFFL